MRKITKALAIGAVVAAVGGIGLAALAETSGPGFGRSLHARTHGARHDGHGRRAAGAQLRRSCRAPRRVENAIGIKPEQAAAWDAYAKVVQDTAVQMAGDPHHKGYERDSRHVAGGAFRIHDRAAGPARAGIRQGEGCRRGATAVAG